MKIALKILLYLARVIFEVLALGVALAIMSWYVLTYHSDTLAELLGGFFG